MKTSSLLVGFLIAGLSLTQFAMARRGQYDEEAREAERFEKSIKKEEKESQSSVERFASGVKESTVDGPKELLSETVSGTAEDPPIIGTLEGARVGSGKVLDRAVKGAVKVATLGQAEIDSYEVTEPEAQSEKPTKITIKIPGT